MGCTPAGRGLESCSQGQWPQSQKESQNFHPWQSTIPSTRFLEASQRKGLTLLSQPLRFGVVLGFLGGAAGTACTGYSPTPAPGRGRAGLALTKQLSMEQETRAVRLMVAGCLDQRTCPRSPCAARQPRAPAASRLQAPPDAAAARSKHPGAKT